MLLPHKLHLSILTGRTIYELVCLFLSSSAPSLSLFKYSSPPGRNPHEYSLILGVFLVGGNEYNQHSHPAIDLNFWSAAVGTPDLDWSGNLRNFSSDDGWRNRHYATAICYPSQKLPPFPLFLSLSEFVLFERESGKSRIERQRYR